MNTEEILVAGKKLISDPRNWLKGTMSDGCDGYCAWGAVRKVGNSRGGMEVEDNKNYFKALSILDRLSGGEITLFNDHPETTHVDIINLFDKAIQEAHHG